MRHVRVRRATLTDIGRALTSAVLIAAVGLLAACAGGLGGGRIFRVDAGSMEPTLRLGERVAVAPLSGTPHIGDIVVSHPPEGAEVQRCGLPHGRGEMCSRPPLPEDSAVNFIERIVAGPGDEVFLKQGHLYRRAAGSSGFVREQDSYTRPCGETPQCTYPKPITVPAGHWFLLGDNRGESDDSRFWGPVPTSWLVGTVQL